MSRDEHPEHEMKRCLGIASERSERAIRALYSSLTVVTVYEHIIWPTLNREVVVSIRALFISNI
jgi:hypothetical protein